MATVAVNPFSSYAASPTAPAQGAVAVTPSDTDELVTVSRGILIGAAGTLHVTMVDGSELTFASGALLVGVVYPLQVRQVHAAGTTATPIYALV